MAKAVHSSILSALNLSYASGRLQPDGAIRSAQTHSGFYTISALTEVTVEVGEGDYDPLAQAENAYVAIYSSEEAQPIREACCCPAFIIGMASPNIIVGGVVFADQLIAQTLTDFISIIPRPGQPGRSPLDDTGYRIARLFRALRVCIEDLDGYYSQVVRTIAPVLAMPVAGVIGGHPAYTSARGVPTSSGATRTTPLSPSFIGPHFTKYLDGKGNQVVLTYKERLIPHFSMKAVFVAEATKTGSEEATVVVVKFAYNYNREAHVLLSTASSPQVPELWFCEYVDSVGMWVVVMEYIEGHVDDDNDNEGGLTDTAHISSLRKAVKMLHDRHLVFGDLRRPNVLMVEDGVAVLIDFDWCGKHSGVQRGGLIEQAHDEHLFFVLTGKSLYRNE